MKRKFILGEEWIYYKIYCSIRFSDRFIVESLYPIIQELKESSIIDKWFFIRYRDPDYHLRIRLHLIEKKKIGSVILKIKDALKMNLDNGLIWKVDTSTYEREIERYGPKSIGVAEDFFCYDSEYIVKAYQLLDNEEELALFTIKIIDCLLEDFGFNEDQKRDFFINGSRMFHDEFNTDKKLKKALNEKYKKLNLRLIDFMNDQYPSEKEDALTSIICERSKLNRTLNARLNSIDASDSSSISKHHLLYSFVHMHINRVFRTQQRKYELVCYDLINQFYKASKFSRKTID